MGLGPTHWTLYATQRSRVTVWAYLAGFNKPLADWAVLAANDAKLVDGKPVILEGGKIGKPEGWKPPDLSAYV